MDSATLIQSVLQGISLAVVCDVVRDFLVLSSLIEKLKKIIYSEFL